MSMTDDLSRVLVLNNQLGDHYQNLVENERKKTKIACDLVEILLPLVRCRRTRREILEQMARLKE